MTAMFEERMKEKGLVFTLSVPEGNNIHVKGDRFKLEQVMINLLDNAVKYTDKGEIKVTAAAEPHTAVITVEDTGIGIPAEHLHRIYERFYVVDKSRSKKSGGTGLGLSIVKHILLLHNGSIKVESAAGRGTRFIIRLPA
jgi:two-component system phosphate regulon sensor histidine kinase PhoR